MLLYSVNCKTLGLSHCKPPCTSNAQCVIRRSAGMFYWVASGGGIIRDGASSLKVLDGLSIMQPRKRDLVLGLATNQAQRPSPWLDPRWLQRPSRLVGHWLPDLAVSLPVPELA